MKLTKGQRTIILLSVFYVIFIYLAADIDLDYNDGMLRFIVFTIPVWGYWSGVWVFGFGWLRKLWQRIRKFVYALLLIAIVGVVAFVAYQEVQLRIRRELRVQIKPVRSKLPLDDDEVIEWEPVNIPVAGEKKPVDDEWGEWEPVKSPVIDMGDEYRKLPEVLEHELRRIRKTISN